ncbi:MAG: MerR family transcriptional regulator [Deltaproteobacteria bacterium]|jgi:DNA-binding transcriptional MerR regulator|nr:MerR family transcriptional regulator [Deltaproteobacteria bacterium]
MEPKADEINEKYYYKIGEAAKKIGVEPYVIRYWETEFSFLRPYKSKSSHRLYSKSDIEKLLLVKDYLYDKKFTIEGAKKAIRSKSSGENISNLNNPGGTDNSNASESGASSLLKGVKGELESIKSLLSSRKTGNQN